MKNQKSKGIVPLKNGAFRVFLSLIEKQGNNTIRFNVSISDFERLVGVIFPLCKI
jgi:hypothetical protein